VMSVSVPSTRVSLRVRTTSAKIQPTSCNAPTPIAQWGLALKATGITSTPGPAHHLNFSAVCLLKTSDSVL